MRAPWVDRFLDPPLRSPRIAWQEGIVTSGRQQRNDCPNGTNMNIIQPTSIFDLSQEIEEGGGFLDSTTYANNGLENWFSLICTNIKLSL